MEPTPTQSPPKYRTLTLDEATKALILERNQDKRNNKSWLQGEDRIALLDAIDHSSTQVYLHLMERDFTIVYYDNRICIKPSNGTFVPCGEVAPQAIRAEIANEHNSLTF